MFMKTNGNDIIPFVVWGSTIVDTMTVHDTRHRQFK